ncbi:hypothetical protein PV375_05565 [Gulosibacter sp. GYB002]|uniref:hypothetical protein n=1 Tax=Gulosibacter sp. GYB002 TaxID=2994391 RepID=UPI002F96BBDF
MAALPQIIAAIVSAIGGAIPQLVMAGVELLTALITNLPQIISTIVAAIPQIITGIVGAVGQGVGQMASAGADLVRGLVERHPIPSRLALGQGYKLVLRHLGRHHGLFRHQLAVQGNGVGR